jgi:thiol-disulfide isomerase/thioredoxin
MVATKNVGYEMNFKFIIISIIILLILSVLAGFLWCPWFSPNYKKDVTEKFKNNDAYIEYYSMSRCGHCNAFNPEWEKFAKGQSNVIKYVIDKDVEARKKSEELGITGFPTVLVFKDGKKHSYTGERTCVALKEFCLGKNIDITTTCK